MKGLRAQIVEKLVKINNVQRWVVSDWRGATKVLDRTTSPYSYRKARPEELPENDIEALRQLRGRMRIVQDYAADISELAAEQIAKLERK